MSAALSITRLHPDLERVALLGWRLVPVLPSRAGFFKGYIQAATSDIDQIERWQFEYPGCNWSVIPEGSGIFALDVDVPGERHKDDGAAALRALEDRHGPLPPHPHGRSPGLGHLMVFRDVGAPIKCEPGAAVPGVDPKAGRVQFTISPSIRHGRPYSWEVAPWEVSPPVAPAWVHKLFAPPPSRALPARPQILTADRAARALARAIDDVAKAGPGQRNATLNRAAYTAGGLAGAGALSETEAVRALYSAGRHIGLDDAECRATIRSGFEAGRANPMATNT